MGRFIPFFRTKYETKLPPAEVMDRIRGKVAQPEWGVTIPKMIQYRIMTGKIIGNDFELSNNRYGLTHGRLNYLLITKGSVRAEKQSGKTIISLAIRPPEPTIWLYIIVSILMILLVRYGIRTANIMVTVIGTLFIIGPYLSLLIQLPKAIDDYRRFIERDILNW